jgi:hypothetical protein
VSEEDGLLAVVRLVPRHAVAARAVRAERAQLRQVFDCLLPERDAGTHARVDDEVRPEVNPQRQRVEVSRVTLAPRFEFGDALRLMRLELDGLAL